MVRMGKSGPLECAQLASQIEGFRIQDRSDAWENNNYMYMCIIMYVYTHIWEKKKTSLFRGRPPVSPDEWATTKQACRDELVVYVFFFLPYILRSTSMCWALFYEHHVSQLYIVFSRPEEGRFVLPKYSCKLKLCHLFICVLLFTSCLENPSTQHLMFLWLLELPTNVVTQSCQSAQSRVL